MADHFRNPLPKIKKEYKRFLAAFKAGTLPKHDQNVKILLKYTNKSGTPNKRALRSKAAIAAYNKALTAYNKERPTAKKEAERDKRIRQKQRETIRRNVLPSQAEEAIKTHDKMVDIMVQVKDITGQSLKSPVVMEMILSNPELTPEQVADHIINQYTALQDSLPSYARRGSDTDLYKVQQHMVDLIDQTGSYNMEVLDMAGRMKAQSPAAWANFQKVNKAMPGATAEQIRRGMALRAGGKRGAYANYIKAYKEEKKKARRTRSGRRL